MYLAQSKPMERLAEMQGTTRHRKYQLVWLALHGLVVVSVLGLALVGHMPVEAGGWVIRPAVCAGSPRAGGVFLLTFCACSAIITVEPTTALQMQG